MTYILLFSAKSWSARLPFTIFHLPKVSYIMLKNGVSGAHCTGFHTSCAPEEQTDSHQPFQLYNHTVHKMLTQ